MNIKKRIIRLWILWALIGLWVFWRVQYTLYQSKATADQIVSRSITEPTTSTPKYLEEQAQAVENQWALSQVADSMEEEEILAGWSFNRIDPIHRAEWTIEVVWDQNDVFLKFPKDFLTTNGPDLYVVLTLWNTYDEDTSLNLWPLVDIQWEQVYKITRQEREQYQGWAVVIWCRAFDVTFSVAEFISL
jgi:hypothetical protein